MSQTFPEARNGTVGIEQDPESAHQWIQVDVLVAGNAKEIRLRHREYVRRLLELLQWPASVLIRTNYTLELFDPDNVILRALSQGAR